MNSRHFVAYLRYQDTDADPIKMILPPAAGNQFASHKLDQAVAYVLEHCEKDTGSGKRDIQALIEANPFYTIAVGNKLYEVDFEDREVKDDPRKSATVSAVSETAVEREEVLCNFLDMVVYDNRETYRQFDIFPERFGNPFRGYQRKFAEPPKGEAIKVLRRQDYYLSVCSNVCFYLSRLATGLLWAREKENELIEKYDGVEIQDPRKRMYDIAEPIATSSLTDLAIHMFTGRDPQKLYSHLTEEYGEETTAFSVRDEDPVYMLVYGSTMHSGPTDTFKFISSKLFRNRVFNKTGARECLMQLLFRMLKNAFINSSDSERKTLLDLDTRPKKAFIYENRRYLEQARELFGLFHTFVCSDALQAASNVNPDKLKFDFNDPDKVDWPEIRQEFLKYHRAIFSLMRKAFESDNINAESRFLQEQYKYPRPYNEPMPDLGQRPRLMQY